MTTNRKNVSSDAFFVLSSNYLDDKTLSFKAKGILTYILSKPDDWEINQTEIASKSKDGIDSVRTGIKELINKGYLEQV